MTQKALRLDKELFDDLINAVNPKVIICLGKITYEAVTGERVNGFAKQLKDGIPFISQYSAESGIKVYGVPHCGGLGLRNIGGIEKAKEVWAWIAEEL